MNDVIDPAKATVALLDADDQKTLNGEVINVPRGRFATPRERAEALFLNDGGWYQCRPLDGESCGQWSEGEPGDICPCERGVLRAERRPDKGSVFAQVYERYAAKRRSG